MEKLAAFVAWCQARPRLVRWFFIALASVALVIAGIIIGKQPARVAKDAGSATGGGTGSDSTSGFEDGRQAGVVGQLVNRGGELVSGASKIRKSDADLIAEARGRKPSSTDGK